MRHTAVRAATHRHLLCCPRISNFPFRLLYSSGHTLVLPLTSAFRFHPRGVVPGVATHAVRAVVCTPLAHASPALPPGNARMHGCSSPMRVWSRAQHGVCGPACKRGCDDPMHSRPPIPTPQTRGQCEARFMPAPQPLLLAPQPPAVRCNQGILLVECNQQHPLGHQGRPRGEPHIWLSSLHAARLGVDEGKEEGR